MSESFLDYALCQNCSQCEVRGNKLWCKERKQEVKEDETCAGFEKSNEPIDLEANNLVKHFAQKVIFSFIDKLDLAKKLYEEQPYIYDSYKNWWIWDNKNKFWRRVDETDILNCVNDLSLASTIQNKEKNEILEALKQYGRRKEPKRKGDDIYVQFKDKIVIINKDVLTGIRQDPMIIDASPEYFVTNPIPWELGDSEDTPEMDKIFEEWVGKDYVQTLYQILAFCCVPKYFLHRIFCLIGRGSNGKSKFLTLLGNFIGVENICSTELDNLINSRFESARLFKKLVCVMGETNFAELKRTSILKKITGEETMGFEFKNKTPFQDYQYAKLIIATNTLPTTTDKTDGFYRRWVILDFPNQFSEKSDVLSRIPKKEYNNLARKCIKIIVHLLVKRAFENEGTIEDRRKKFEDKSDPLNKFLKENTFVNPDGYIYKYEFRDAFVAWLTEHGYRVWNESEIGKRMRERYDEGQHGEKRYRAWDTISWKIVKKEKDLNNLNVETEKVVQTE